MKNCFDFDYNNSILSLSNSLLKYYGLKPFHPTLSVLDKALSAQNHKNIIFMILDGMGTDIIKRHLPQNSFISKHITSSIYSVFPPTTAAATISLHSGLSPLESGWLGWMCYYKEYDRTIETFLNTDYYSGEKLTTPPPADTILHYKSIYSRITEHNPDVKYHRVLPPFAPEGVQTFEEMCRKIVKISAQDKSRKIISAYWTEPDHSMHHFGVDSAQAKAQMQHIEKCLQQMYADIQDAFIIITADHGQIDTTPLLLNDTPELCQMFLRPPALEARVITFWIKPEKEADFSELFNRKYGQDFKLYTKSEFFASGFLGEGNPHPKTFDFIGDFVAVSLGKKSLHYDAGIKEKSFLIGEHAGISEAEMKVPLIIAEKD